MKQQPNSQVQNDSLGKNLDYRTLFENAPIGMAITRRNGEFLTVNKAFQTDTYYNHEDFQKIKAVELYEYPEDRKAFLLQVDKYGRVEDFEVRIKRKDGTTFPALLNADPILFRDFEAFLTSIRNISALKESEERFRNIIHSIPIGLHIYHLDDDGRLIFIGANPAADDLLGVDNTQFIGKTIESAFPPLAETEIPSRYREAAEKGVSWKTEQIEYADDQIAGAFQVDAFQSSKNYMVASFLDITDRLVSQMELRKAKQRAEFFTDLMAHDLNNIHQGILVSLELMNLNKELPSGVKALLNASLDQTRRGIRLITNVRKLSVIDKSTKNLYPFDLHEAISEVIPIVKFAFPEREISINLRIDPMHYRITVDELIGDVFYNLLHNSVKADRNEKVIIDVCVRGSKDPSFIEVLVEDRGLGIPDDRKKDVLRRTEEKNTTGTGLGLTLVRDIIRFYGGSMWIEDRIPGSYSQGTRFVLSLPIFSNRID